MINSLNSKIFSLFYFFYYFVFLLFFDYVIKLFFFLKKKKIVNFGFCRLDNLGDFILWENFFLIFLKSKPRNKNILLICNVDLKEYINKYNEHVNIIFVYRKKFILNIFYRLKILYDISNFYFENIAQCNITRDFFGCDIILKNSFAKNKYAFISYNDQTKYFNLIKKILSFAHSFFITNLITPISRFESDNNVFMFENLIKTKLNKIKENHKNFSIKNKNYIIISVDSADISRSWLLNYYEKIIDYLIKKTDYDIFITAKEIFQIKNIYLNNVRIKNLSGKTNINQIIELIKYSKLVICNETAVAHFCNKFKKKSIVIMGGGHFNRFIREKNGQNIDNLNQFLVYFKMKCYNCNWDCIYPKKFNNYKCLENIKIKTVLDQCRKQLSL